MANQGRSALLTCGLAVQLGLIVLASAAMLAPPAQGSIAIIPIVPGDPAATFRWATKAGALPIMTGSYQGSIVVQGSLRELVYPALSNGALLITARSSSCGSTPFEERS